MIKINVIWPTFFWPLQHDSTIIERLRMRYTLCYIMIFVYQTSANFMVKYSVQYFRNHHFSAMNMNGYHYICFCHEGYDNLLGGTNIRINCVKKTISYSINMESLSSCLFIFIDQNHEYKMWRYFMHLLEQTQTWQMIHSTLSHISRQLIQIILQRKDVQKSPKKCF